MSIDLNDFLAFLQSKPADEKYNYTKNQDCPVAQYLIARGIHSAPFVAPGNWHGEFDEDRQFFDTKIDSALVGDGFDDWTFGAAADRLAALIG